MPTDPTTKFFDLYAVPEADKLEFVMRAPLATVRSFLNLHRDAERRIIAETAGGGELCELFVSRGSRPGRYAVSRAADPPGSVGSPRKDVLADALAEPVLGEALAAIQNALGIATGDVAASEFSGRDANLWSTLESPDQRAEFVRSWLVAELFDAAYRAAN